MNLDFAEAILHFSVQVLEVKAPRLSESEQLLHFANLHLFAQGVLLKKEKE